MLCHRLTGTSPLQKLVLPLLQRHPDLWPLESHTFEAFKHAVFILMSRGFFSAEIGGPYLVPVADLFNHSHHKRCTHLQMEDGQFVMRAERDIAKGAVAQGQGGEREGGGGG